MNETENILWPGWETVRLVGRGSFGAVYEIQRDVFGEIEKAALKVIRIPQNDSDIEEMHSEGYDEESITSTFKSHLKSIVDEYSLMKKMNGCSNIVNCDDYRYIQHDDGIGWDIFIKMELLTPLIKAVATDCSEATVIKIAKDMCRALELCKEHEIVHRDIKPQNIFVSNHGDYKLGDFGIAKTIEKTMGGTKIGTYKYMAPEVYYYQPYGHSADIYSLGLVLYWLLNERRMPFMPLPPEKLGAGIEEKARNRRLSGETLSEPAHGSKELKRIILKACAYDPKLRYQTATEMLQDINSLSGMPAPPKPVPPIPPQPPEPPAPPQPPEPPAPPKPTSWRCTCGRTHPLHVSTCVCGRSKTNLKKDSQRVCPVCNHRQDSGAFCEKCGHAYDFEITKPTSWLCTCGRIHPLHVSTCVCGRSKTNLKKDSQRVCPVCNHRQDSGAFCEKCGHAYDSEIKKPTLWQCICGRVHPLYVSTCVCGRSKTGSSGKVPLADDITCPICGHKQKDQQVCWKCGHKFNSATSLSDGWQCTCGRIHPLYVSTCVCGNNKTNLKKYVSMENINEAVAVSENPQGEVICPTCGHVQKNKQVCWKCGQKFMLAPFPGNPKSGI